ncbi:MAG: quinol:cytochrome C oxidoreductase [Chitinophagaceae bacterium]
MKKSFWIVNVFALGLAVSSCSDVRRSPGRVYMPDMAYSRAIETYSLLDSTRFTNNLAEIGEGKIYYTAQPVAGTVAIGDMMRFELAMDKPGDSTNYVASKQIQNPLDSLTAGQMKEAERLFLVNCGICHGQKLDGNGPLYNGGNGPYAAAPRNLITFVLPEGQMFYSITYGKGAMGSYASQLSTEQRWMVIKYIKSKQGSAGTTAPATTAASDSTAAPK